MGAEYKAGSLAEMQAAHLYDLMCNNVVPKQERKKSIKGLKARGYSHSSQREVEGTIHHVLANGVNILTDNGLVFVEAGKYEIIE